jgi:hypothetical protein
MVFRIILGAVYVAMAAGQLASWPHMAAVLGAFTLAQQLLEELTRARRRHLLSALHELPINEISELTGVSALPAIRAADVDQIVMFS